jgi:diguanylate cyclase (GGDEF)-like protein
MIMDFAGQGKIAEVLAIRRLRQLEKQTDKALTLLGRLQQDIVEAGDKLGERAAALVEANEELVLSSLRAQTDAENIAHFDALTELPNRLLLRDRLSQAIAVAKRNSASFAVLFLDLNQFKQINDTLGHAVGDEVLKRVAKCLVASVRAVDTVSRHGGDEFLILLPEVSAVADALFIADKIIAALAALPGIGEQLPSVAASIGISLYPEHGADADTLIARADTAMYHAKRHGQGCFVYDQASCVDAPGLAELQAVRIVPLSVEHEHRHAQLREANEHLILAALSADQLRTAAEEAQRKQTEFLAVLAHELRNPLAPITTAAFMLGRIGSGEPQLLQLQGVIERQVVHLSRLVGDLLDVARVNTGKLRLDREPIDITRLINEAVSNCHPAIELRQQYISVHIPTDEVLVLGDPVRLAQVFSNLLNNASKYTPVLGRIELVVEVGDDSLSVTVSDNGIGISAEALPNIFDPFVQDAHATVFNGDGLGIGLTVVRELIEGHGGRVTAASAGTGSGSQFVVILPRA